MATEMEQLGPGSVRARLRQGKPVTMLPSHRGKHCPNKYRFVINLKAAKALGIEVPTNLLLIADDYIE